MPANVKQRELVKEQVTEDIKTRLSLTSADLSKLEGSIKKLIDSIEKNIKTNEKLATNISAFSYNNSTRATSTESTSTEAIQNKEGPEKEKRESIEGKFSNIFDTKTNYSTEKKLPNIFFKSFDEILKHLRSINDNTANEEKKASNDSTQQTSFDYSNNSKANSYTTDVNVSSIQPKTTSRQQSSDKSEAIQQTTVEKSNPSFIEKTKTLDVNIVGFSPNSTQTLVKTLPLALYDQFKPFFEKLLIPKKDKNQRPTDSGKDLFSSLGFPSLGTITKAIATIGLIGGVLTLLAGVQTEGPLKGLTKIIGTGLLKMTLPKFLATFGKTFTKIPIIGSLISIGFAVSRFMSGDIVGGFIDILSGIASLVPGPGTLIAFGLDALNAALDMGMGGSGKEAGAKKEKAMGGWLGKGIKWIGILLKKIPFFGLFMGLGMAFMRFKNGQIVRGFLEIISGVASIMPGVGTVVSIGIDALTTLIDSMEGEEGTPKQKQDGQKEGLWGTFKKWAGYAISKLPIIGFFMGIGKAWERIKQGQVLRGALELLSGIATTFPGIGTAISIGIDGLLAFLDGKEEASQSAGQNQKPKENPFEAIKKAIVEKARKWWKGTWEWVKWLARKILPDNIVKFLDEDKAPETKDLTKGTDSQTTDTTQSAVTSPSAKKVEQAPVPMEEDPRYQQDLERATRAFGPAKGKLFAKKRYDIRNPKVVPENEKVTVDPGVVEGFSAQRTETTQSTVDGKGVESRKQTVFIPQQPATAKEPTSSAQTSQSKLSFKEKLKQYSDEELNELNKRIDEKLNTKLSDKFLETYLNISDAIYEEQQARYKRKQSDLISSMKKSISPKADSSVSETEPNKSDIQTDVQSPAPIAEPTKASAPTTSTPEQTKKLEQLGKLDPLTRAIVFARYPEIKKRYQEHTEDVQKRKDSELKVLSDRKYEYIKNLNIIQRGMLFMTDSKLKRQFELKNISEIKKDTSNDSSLASEPITALPTTNKELESQQKGLSQVQADDKLPEWNKQSAEEAVPNAKQALKQISKPAETDSNETKGAFVRDKAAQLEREAKKSLQAMEVGEKLQKAINSGSINESTKESLRTEIKKIYGISNQEEFNAKIDQLAKSSYGPAMGFSVLKLNPEDKGFHTPLTENQNPKATVSSQDTKTEKTNEKITQFTAFIKDGKVDEARKLIDEAVSEKDFAASKNMIQVWQQTIADRKDLKNTASNTIEQSGPLREAHQMVAEAEYKAITEPSIRKNEQKLEESLKNFGKQPEQSIKTAATINSDIISAPSKNDNSSSSTGGWQAIAGQSESDNRSLLQTIANNTGNSTSNMNSFAAGFNQMAKALERVGEAVGEKVKIPPVVINSQSGEKQQKNVSSTEMAKQGNPAIAQFRAMMENYRPIPA